jgi:hypothetical protein
MERDLFESREKDENEDESAQLCHSPALKPISLSISISQNRARDDPFRFGARTHLAHLEPLTLQELLLQPLYESRLVPLCPPPHPLRSVPRVILQVSFETVVIEVLVGPFCVEGGLCGLRYRIIL